MKDRNPGNYEPVSRREMTVSLGVLTVLILGAIRAHDVINGQSPSQQPTHVHKPIRAFPSTPSK